MFQKEVDVLKYQREKLNTLSNDYANLNSELDDLEKRLKQYMTNNNIDANEINSRVQQQETKVKSTYVETKPQRAFEELVSEAHQAGYKDVNLYEVATKQEIAEVNHLLSKYYKDYTEQYKLDKYDYAIAGIIGTIAAGIDLFLVTKVNGSQVTAGKLKSGVEGFWNTLLSEDKIKALEEKYKVTYDISTNTSKISQEVLGLCPQYHRFQSLGHDPILGFIFGVSDLMKGQLTAIDGNGRLIIQAVNGAETKGLIESIITVFGHFLSDVGTKSSTGKILSVPAPLTPLLQLIQVGSIEYNGKKYTVGDLSKRMYHDGYNFNHFIGMSIPVLLIEILTRLSFVIKEIFFMKSNVSLKGNPKLTVMLCIANGILFAENVGKLVITKNPFAINYVSWIATAKYGFKTFKWYAYDREMGKVAYAQEYIDLDWRYLEASAKEIGKNQEAFIIE